MKRKELVNLEELYFYLSRVSSRHGKKSGDFDGTFAVLADKIETIKTCGSMIRNGQYRDFREYNIISSNLDNAYIFVSGLIYGLRGAYLISNNELDNLLNDLSTISSIAV